MFGSKMSAQRDPRELALDELAMSRMGAQTDPRMAALDDLCGDCYEDEGGESGEMSAMPPEGDDAGLAAMLSREAPQQAAPMLQAEVMPPTDDEREYRMQLAREHMQRGR